jgi:predicted P-loop ATPase/GTPase
MFANSKIINQRSGLSVYQLAARSVGYSRLINTGKRQILDTQEYIPKNYERLSLQDQIIVRNRLRHSNYTTQKVDKITEHVNEESKRLEQEFDMAESDTEEVDKANC